MLLEKLPGHADVLIVGGGPVGALVVQKLASAGIDALLVDAKPKTEADPRALALSWASREALEQVGLWGDDLAATAIEKVHISQQGTLGRTELLASELDLPALGFVVDYDKLTRRTFTTLSEGKAKVALGFRVTKIKRLARYAQITLQSAAGEHSLTTRLVVLADGGSLIQELDDIVQTIKPYQQHAILAKLTPLEPHAGMAYERFANDATLALLPNGRDFTLVWPQTPAEAQTRLSLSDEDFIREVSQRFSGRIAGFSAVGPRASWPLALKTLSSVAGRRVVLIGNAAQTLHPVAGQGLNLGLRDATTLASLLLATPQDELGEPESLARYARLRKKDAGLVTQFTDGLITFFDHPGMLLKHGRSLGLIAMDQMPWLRKGFARRMVFGAR
ncbi:MAG: FAD-dependent monooxygenase [Iodobacter sp.]